jgi:ParB family transcriptional regulator, chromosome partitioning protein
MPSERRILYLNPRDLLPSRDNVRSDPGDLAGLAETIREHGILQPLGVTREGENYRIVYGNRRRDAAIVVGLDRVPCLLLDELNEEGAVVQQVLENLQRLDLNDLDKSRAFERLLAHLVSADLSQGEALDRMARTLGLSARTIQRYLRLRQLAPEVQRLIAQGDLGVTHAQHLAELSPSERQEAVAMLVAEESLSAAELARLVAALEHNTNIDPRLALEMLRRGERIAVVEAKPPDAVSQFFGPTPPEDKGEEAAGPAEEEFGEVATVATETPRSSASSSFAERDDDGGMGGLEPITRDGNRVRKIHSLDAFMDEVQRLAQCVQEGDLQRFLGEDDTGQLKIRLAARQLRYLADTVATLAKASGGE